MGAQTRKYKLINNDISQSATNPLWLTNNPRNSDKSKRTLKRSIKSFATFTQYSDDFEFTKEAKTFLDQAFDFKDTEAEVYMEEWREHPQTEVLYLYNSSKFNFAQIIINKTFTSIPFKTGGLNQLLKAQLKEKFELERLESINGKVIDALDTKEVALTSRSILLISVLENADEESSTLAISSGARVPNLTAISNDDDENVNDTYGSDQWTGTAGTEHFFYLKSDVSKTINLIVDWDIDITGSGFSTVWFQVAIKRYSWNGSTYIDEQTYYYYGSASPNYESVKTFIGTNNMDITLNVDDSLLMIVSSVGGGTVGGGIYYQTQVYNKLKVTDTEESIREDSRTKAILFHEAGEKLMQIITGEKNRYYSEFYESGEFALTGVALGLWIRQFNDKKIEWSLQDRLKTANVIHNTGYNIEIINNVETLVEEDLKYFFQEATAIVLPDEINNEETFPAKLFYHSSLEFGYKKPDGDNLYEEAMGLDEFNTRNGYVNNLITTEKKYSKISPDRADSYGKEFARRKLQLNYPEEDTRYDKDKHILDLKPGLGQALEERTHLDDYEIAPTGVYSPDTATGLRLTPARIKKRHEWFFSSILQKHKTEFIRFSNSVNNSELVTKKVGETALAENGDTLNSDLERALFIGQFITFDHRITFDINEQIYGKTEVNGRMIPNFYFRVKYKHQGKWKFGYLFEVTEEGREIGKFNLLKSI
jgi:hypothetical protein